ncbi:RES family NAD+ phosphorylase [Burkholderia vietnamiensis]|uniref:RES family NAD+ phosphorylase n=1 Tax=Burkholderia vietnamiensis TaxID=60552 RepID=UPI001D15D6EE|nr:RES family NAD+ phosphorylase [Burkholderia vietnamiensis]UEC01669.1 RES family NAD+ phosphorylase [Burkholderia vietnamiensis]
MAKPRKSSSASSAPASSGSGEAGDARPASTPDSTPAPPATLHVTPWTLSSEQVLHRVHSDQYRADEFNPGKKGNARFSPIHDAEGKPIPTIYAAATFDAAAMESVFHDVSHAPGYKNYAKEKLEGQVHSEVQAKHDLKLADLGSVALHKLGVQRKQLIDTEKDQYPSTRQWAEAIHAQHPDIQGLSWVSRQDDTARAVVLFGDRVPKGTLQQVGGSRSLLQDEQAYSELLDLAERIGVDVTPEK